MYPQGISSYLCGVLLYNNCQKHTKPLFLKSKLNTTKSNIPETSLNNTQEWGNIHVVHTVSRIVQVCFVN